MQNLISTDAVRSESFGTDVLEKSPFYICLNSIMNLDVMLLCKSGNMIDSPAEQFHIVIIERCRNPVKLLYCIDVKHIYPNIEKRLQK